MQVLGFSGSDTELTEDSDGSTESCFTTKQVQEQPEDHDKQLQVQKWFI